MTIVCVCVCVCVMLLTSGEAKVTLNIRRSVLTWTFCWTEKPRSPYGHICVCLCVCVCVCVCVQLFMPWKLVVSV